MKTKEWYVIDSESESNYSHHDLIKFLTKSIESSLCHYSDAYILVKGNITVTRTLAGDPVRRKRALDAATQVVFKNHLKNVLQKLMVLLLMKQILLILPCLCTIWLNTVTIILILQEVYGALKKTR